MKLTMYWDIYGNYLKYEIKKDVPLTKLNHKPFNEDDYLKLHKILNNPDSEFKMCTYDDLTSEEVENQYHVDAISGAILAEIDFEYINGAIKTTYALWKIAHGNICEAIRKQTVEVLQTKMEKKDWIHQLENSSPEAMTDIYMSGDDMGKMLFYCFLVSQNHLFKPEMMTFLKSQISEDNAMIYAGALNNLAKIPVDRSYCKDVLLPLLTKSQGLKYMVTYNAIQRSGQARLLKKQKMNIWSK